VTRPLLDGEQYRLWMDALVETFRPVQLVPLDEMREHLGRAETLGPILEPTAYQRGGADNLDDQRDILNAAYAVRRATERIRERMQRRGARA
jgi:hypothetical protein